MKSSIIASAALVAAAAASSVGSAVVVNKCDQDVYLYNTPSADGGYTEIDKVLSTGDSYTQEWTELSNGNGWSMKLSNSTSLVDILQYEYTYQDDDTIWYDLSEVNGNPWDGNWEITSDTDTCVPRQAAYRYATDNAYGEQSCPSDSTITVTLCSGTTDDESSSSSSSSSSSAAAESTTASSTTAESTSAYSTSAEYTLSSSTTAEYTPSTTAATSTSSPATTLRTSVLTTSSASNEFDVVVTVTEITTATAWAEAWTPKKREAHQHHAARHPHHRN